MLTTWYENEGEAATPDELQFVLDRSKMGDLVADGILNGATPVEVKTEPAEPATVKTEPTEPASIKAEPETAKVKTEPE